MKKFVYNKEKLQYDEHKASFMEILGRAMLFLLLAGLIALLYYAVIALFVSNSKEKKLQQENAYLEEEIRNMEEKVALVDDVIKNLDIRDKAIYNDIFNSNPPYIEYSFFGESDSLDMTIDLNSQLETDLIMHTNAQCHELEKEVASVKKEIGVITEIIETEDFMPKKIPSIIPLKNFTLAQTGASIGMKIHPYYKTLKMHTGIDLVAPLGTDVYASADGVVTKVERLNKGFGHTVTIDHVNGMETFYAHLGDIYVRNGQHVGQGTLIGRVGNSGTVFASSLHYEVRRDGQFLDPINFFFASISPAVCRRMFQIAINTGQSLD